MCPFTRDSVSHHPEIVFDIKNATAMCDSAGVSLKTVMLAGTERILLVIFKIHVKPFSNIV